MNITEIAEYVWEKSETINFGSKDDWHQDLFTKKWAKGKPFEDVWNKSGAGWYWFLLDMTYDEMHKLQKPASLPESGCDIGAMTHNNKDVFKDALLCASESGIIVVYNGHEKKVTARIRSHFSLNNNRTGALGIIHYPLSKQQWQVKFFSTQCFKEINDGDKKQIELLINSSTGRCAVESAWRAKYRWPILCKE